MPTTPLRLVSLAVLSIVAVGCSASSDSAAMTETANLRSIVSLYNYATTKFGRPPANEQEFKQFIATEGTTIMERLNVTGPDELFVSERDGQPLVVVYGQRPQGMSRDVIAYEQTGVDGMRQVGTVLGMVQEVDESRFRELVPESATPIEPQYDL